MAIAISASTVGELSVARDEEEEEEDAREVDAGGRGAKRRLVRDSRRDGTGRVGTGRDGTGWDGTRYETRRDETTRRDATRRWRIEIGTRRNGMRTDMYTLETADLRGYLHIRASCGRFCATDGIA